MQGAAGAACSPGSARSRLRRRERLPCPPAALAGRALAALPGPNYGRRRIRPAAARQACVGDRQCLGRGGRSRRPGARPRVQACCQPTGRRRHISREERQPQGMRGPRPAPRAEGAVERPLRYCPPRPPQRRRRSGAGCMADEAAASSPYHPRPLPGELRGRGTFCGMEARRPQGSEDRAAPEDAGVRGCRLRPARRPLTRSQRCKTASSSLSCLILIFAVRHLDAPWRCPGVKGSGLDAKMRCVPTGTRGPVNTGDAQECLPTGTLEEE
ncbi:uncharacterized protein [Patagioenas fasciata]|uniref:uncharacterized protein n=1 Tax=Patagioenas fasciata TaxID=372321 RepID=UPI003A98F758